MDDDFDLEATRAQPSKGRRAGQKKADKGRDKVEKVEKQISDLSLGSEKKRTPEKPPRARNRQMGWETNNNSPEKEVIDSRLLLSSDDDEGETVMEFIPDLDDIHEEDIIQEVAAPPQAFNKDIATYRELDVDLMNRAAFRTIDDTIDMKVLVKNLSSQSDIHEEPDRVWEWDKLFADVCSNLKTKKSTSAGGDDNQ